MKYYNVRKGIVNSLICLLFLSFLLSSCGTLNAVDYKQISHFTNEQTKVIRTAYGVPDDVSISIFSLTTDNAWRDTSFILIFAMEQNEWKKWEAFKITATDEKKYIVFNDVGYYLSQKGKIEPNHICYEYLPLEGTGPALYSIHNFLSFPAEADLRPMLKEFGESVDGFSRYETVI